MRLLLDTHALYWWLNDAPHLSATARAAILASPFDRMLVAQALEEELTLVSDDRRLPLYRQCGLELMSCA